jgi:hypothetical protein
MFVYWFYNLKYFKILIKGEIKFVFVKLFRIYKSKRKNNSLIDQWSTMVWYLFSLHLYFFCCSIIFHFDRYVLRLSLTINGNKMWYTIANVFLLFDESYLLEYRDTFYFLHFFFFSINDQFFRYYFSVESM